MQDLELASKSCTEVIHKYICVPLHLQKTEFFRSQTNILPKNSSHWKHVVEKAYSGNPFSTLNDSVMISICSILYLSISFLNLWNIMLKTEGNNSLFTRRTTTARTMWNPSGCVKGCYNNHCLQLTFPP